MQLPRMNKLFQLRFGGAVFRTMALQRICSSLESFQVPPQTYSYQFAVNDSTLTPVNPHLPSNLSPHPPSKRGNGGKIAEKTLLSPRQPSNIPSEC